MQDAGDPQQGVAEKRYVTVPVAAKLAGCPESYIEHLCKDDYLPHAFNKSGGFLPQIDALFSVLHLDSSQISDIELVPASVVTTNPNGLPEHWPLVTEKDSSAHHEDAPLLPPLQKKELNSGVSEEPLIEVEKTALLDTDTASALIADTLTAPELGSGIVDEELAAGTAPEQFLLDKGEEEVVVSVPQQEESSVDVPADLVDIQEEPTSVPPVIQPEPVLEAESNEPVPDIATAEVNIEASIPDSLNDVVVADERQTVVSQPVVESIRVENPAPRNPRPIVASKIVPVPHVPISQTIPSAHPLALAPSVVPFSTSAPAAHTKVAAVYTQPTARAVEWLPWMRTSLWPKRRVARATAHGEISNEHSGFPAVKQGGPTVPNVMSHAAAPRIEKTQVHNAVPESVIWEAPAPIINMEPEPVVPLRVASAPLEYIEPKINDSLDSAFFGDFTQPKAQNEIPQQEVKDVFAEALANVPAVKQDTPVVQERIGREKPEINDSWDAAFFSKN